MSIRDKPIYISHETSRMLWFVAKADQSIKPESNSITTPDEIADIMLKQALREQYPELITRLAEIDALEKSIIKSIAKK